MSDQIEDLIREIATKHGIAVARDDPILVLQTINNRLLMDSAKAQQEMLDTYKSEMESLAHRWAMDAKEKAERILNASLTASSDAMAKMMSAQGDAAGRILQAELEVALARLALPMQDVDRIARINIVASVITMAAAAVALWTVLWH